MADEPTDPTTLQFGAQPQPLDQDKEYQELAEANKQSIRPVQPMYVNDQTNPRGIPTGTSGKMTDNEARP